MLIDPDDARASVGDAARLQDLLPGHCGPDEFLAAPGGFTRERP